MPSEAQYGSYSLVHALLHLQTAFCSFTTHLWRLWLHTNPSHGLTLKPKRKQIQKSIALSFTLAVAETSCDVNQTTNVVE